jgi:hypothetical protein
MRAIQTFVPDSFCPLTNPQPYQREQDELPRAGVRVAGEWRVELMQSWTVRQLAVSSIASLGLTWMFLLPLGFACLLVGQLLLDEARYVRLG